MADTTFHAQPGYRSGGTHEEAFLIVQERESDSWSLVAERAEFTLRLLPDTREVVLLKKQDDGEWEAVYSEAVS